MAAPLTSPDIWQRLRRLLFRNTMAALVATAAEFIVVGAMKSYLAMTPWLATAMGCLFGGIVNFAINRRWTFESHAPGGRQALRYGAVSIVGSGLAYQGVAWGCQFTHLDWRLVWALTHVVCSWGWHLPMQRFVVFGKPAYPRRA